LSPDFRAGQLDRLTSQRAPLLLLLGSDIAAAERRHDLWDGHVLVHHLGAALVGLLGERHDGRIAGMAHHRDAARFYRNRLAQLLNHSFVVPARENIVHLRTEIGLGLLRAVIDDGAEGIAFRTADEKADVDVLAPFRVEGLGGPDGCRAKQCRGSRREGRAPE
jgi:hypothetical protein